MLALLRKALMRRALEGANEVTAEDMNVHLASSPLFADVRQEPDLYTDDDFIEINHEFQAR